MARIIAGVWGGRRLATPKGAATRPTSDRVREALFSSLESELGGFDGLRVLDLYAGSGALGLEALSRGAEHVDLVDSDRRACASMRDNVAALGLTGRRATLHAEPVERFLRHAAGPYDLVLLDPPYRDDPSGVVAGVVPILAASGVVVVERSARDALVWPDGIDALRDKSYGDTRLWFGIVSAEQGPGETDASL